MSRTIQGHGSKYSRKREAAIAALLSQRTIEEAARMAGISKPTLVRWLKLSEFQEACRKARREAVAQADARLQQASPAAASTLIKLMLDPATPVMARARVADSILDRAHEAVQMEELETRLHAVERLTQEMRSDRR